MTSANSEVSVYPVSYTHLDVYKRQGETIEEAILDDHDYGLE